MNKIRLGVIGTGSIGKNHARVLSELKDVEFAAIYDTDTATAQEMARRFNSKAVDSLEEFAGLVDAATIATPTPTHFKIASTLLQRGIHVLVEKPITENTADARALSKLAHDQGLVLQVGHIERFNPVLSALEGKLNRPRFIESHRLSPYPSRSTEIGVVLDLMIHDLEIILHLVRSPLKSVDAVGVPVLSRGEDIANARLRFENGCVANITVSRISPEKMRKIRVFQEDGYLSLDYQAQEGFMYRLAGENEPESSLFKKLLAAKDHAVVSQFAGKRIVREPVEILKGEPLHRELSAFVECARAGSTPKVSGYEATAALELALEITRQIEESNRKV
ncbi:MAG: Oxidoreductase domain protein [Chthoniobacteraceae bacterium]|nr:Oxidoreductase domain protein [Chthoniobacteraceae bacterium]MDB6173354.1 Oxidoreductase domain protein [Chthoniobacteraceae bacterium]